ncbi:hypothetical protein O7626_35225 [Micromonospora sp. WMMD1102]|uniref:hypothetical protein n=1 Tax=Micromonospora sp. WMMD1102 TaxID=3016105 RepID=UPI00241544B2|nr:hypothetical protein [Micromonospora sp. WMMD1102]MDG4791100.1 hypothetical protein [Micromonospora sp. WMMD1102]
MAVDPHIQALRDLLVAEHEEYIAKVQGWADEAGARGDEWYQRWHQDHATRLREMAYPWEQKESAA